MDMPYEISPDYQRVHQRNLLYARLEWDESVKDLYKGLGPLPRSLDRISRKQPGYNLIDYALLSAGRYVDGFNDTVSSSTKGKRDLFSAKSQAIRGKSLSHESWQTDPRLQAARAEIREDHTPEELTQVVKRAARFLGADLVGVARYDPRWVYSHLYRVRDSGGEGWANSRRARPGDFPDDEVTREVALEMPQAKSVIVLAFEEDHGAINTSPAFPNGGAVGLAYSQMAFTTSSLAEFLWVLGFWARATGNDLALSIPFAVMAGLGEMGRHGQLITKAYGSRIRLAKVITDVELVPDSPDLFGVWEFCKVCKKCANTCPGRAIPFDDEPTWHGPNHSNNPGVLKWHVDAELCSRYMKANGGECSNCHSRCPYNKDYGHWYHRLARDIAPKLGKGVASALVRLDDILGYGSPVPADEWWRSKP